MILTHNIIPAVNQIELHLLCQQQELLKLMKKYDIKTTDVETLKKWYYLMSLGRALDEKAPSYQLQSLGWSYHAPYAGHDGIQLAIGQVFTKGEDFLFPY